MDLGRVVEAVVGVQARDGGGLNQGGHSGDGEAGGPNQEIPRGDVNGTGARIRPWGRGEGGGPLDASWACRCATGWTDVLFPEPALNSVSLCPVHPGDLPCSSSPIPDTWKRPGLGVNRSPGDRAQRMIQGEWERAAASSPCSPTAAGGDSTQARTDHCHTFRAAEKCKEVPSVKVPLM